MAYAVALRVLREDADARDVVQDAYVAAFKRLAELIDVQAFPVGCAGSSWPLR